MHSPRGPRVYLPCDHLIFLYCMHDWPSGKFEPIREASPTKAVGLQGDLVTGTREQPGISKYQLGSLPRPSDSTIDL